MNLSPVWEPFFQINGIDAVHWIKIGHPEATDQEIFGFARDHGYVIFTNDLDFGAILAATSAPRPSVIQTRVQNLVPEHIGDTILRCLAQFKNELECGCILTLDSSKAKVRLLPLNN